MYKFAYPNGNISTKLRGNIASHVNESHLVGIITTYKCSQCEKTIELVWPSDTLKSCGLWSQQTLPASSC